MKLSDLNNLDFNNVGAWPLLAKVIAALIVGALGVGVGYWFFIQPNLEGLDAVRLTEQQLRQEFREKQRVMANIDAYRAQLEDMQETLDAMLRQLPTRTEMPDLLEVISNTGRKNGLNFELFKPEGEQPREFYAAKPISIKAQASYHQLGAFIGNIAALSRIVTLESVNLVEQQQETGRATRARTAPVQSETKPLLIEATLQTYRYLEEEEQQPAAKGPAKASPPRTPTP
jgi:type IV pilus assembly protein PilO